MKRTWTIIGVADVARSFSVDDDGTVLLCLHCVIPMFITSW